MLKQTNEAYIAVHEELVVYGAFFTKAASKIFIVDLIALNEGKLVTIPPSQHCTVRSLPHDVAMVI